MNSTEILQLLEAIAQSPKKTDKERLLREAACDDLALVLKAAYDPTLNYYIKKVPTTAAGELDFTINTWFLLEHLSGRVFTGNEALNMLKIELETLNIHSQELLTRIIKRDLRCGINDSTINKVFPKLIPTYPYMRYNLLNKVKWQNYEWERGVFVQLKMDQMYASIDLYGGKEVVMLSRQGTHLPEEPLSGIISDVVNNLEPSYQYHGELVLHKDGKPVPRDVGNGLLNSMVKSGVLEEGYTPVYYVWDMVELSVIQGEKLCTTEYEQRFEKLSELVKDTANLVLVKSKRVRSIEDVYGLYAKALAARQEGVMVKRPSLLWKNGTTADGAKLKLEVDVDLKIKGFTKGNGKFASTFGAIEMESSCGGLQTDVSGMSDELRLYIHLNRDNLLGTIGTVRANDITKSTPAALFHGRLIELRTDKTIADSLEEIIDQFENAKMGVK